METNKPILYGRLPAGNLISTVRAYFASFLRPDPDGEEFQGMPYSLVEDLAGFWATDTRFVDERWEAEDLIDRVARCALAITCHWRYDLPYADTSTIASVLLNHAVEWEISDIPLPMYIIPEFMVNRILDQMHKEEATNV